MPDFGSMTIFLAIGGLGFLFLLASLILGDIFEALGLDFGGPSDGNDVAILDSRVISVFMTAFGGFGVIGVTLGFGGVGSAFFGLLGGLIFGALVFYFGKFLTSQQSSSSVSADMLVGRTAQVIVGIKPGQLGQISVRIGEDRVEKLARFSGDEEIKAGQIVRIEAVGGDSVIVSLDTEDKTAYLSGRS